MVVQHNMSAMNANRMLGVTSRAQAKSTEKLSSGYRINRAADDAAGLSISEKMRSQIRGLNQASSNAQDGISLIQTAEGALNEQHAILQRMRELSVQAANGTETDDDRQAVQDEIAQLQEELTRISETTEFNTMKLLDGSLGGGSSQDGVKVNANVNTAALAGGALATTAAENGVYTSATALAADSGMKAGDTTSLTINYLNEKGEQESLTIDLTYKDATTLVSADGSREYSVASGAATAANKDAAFLAELKQSTLAEDFTITSDAAGKFTFTAKTAGTDTARILSTQETAVKDGVLSSVAPSNVAATTGTPADAYQSYDSTVMNAYTGAAGENVEDYILEVNGEKFIMVDSDGANALKGSEYSDINIVFDADEMANVISAKTGINATNDSGVIDLKAGAGSTVGGGKGMTLQIGANEKQTMTFHIGDMSARALGVGKNKVDLSTQESAKKAMTTFDNAIKKVSQTRGQLGAIQNRLEHTISNLDTSSENMQTAESRIRDLDMATEMVNYSKNNILAQAGQSMLAQANQSTQGVLSLLQ